MRSTLLLPLTLLSVVSARPQQEPQDNGFDGPIFPTSPVGATEWQVGTTNTISLNITPPPSLSFSALTIEWCTGSDTNQPVLETVYDGDFPTGSTFEIDFEQPSVRDLGYPYGQRYFFKFTSTSDDGLRYNWTTRYWVLPADGEDDDWPNVGAWEGEFEGQVDGFDPSTSTSTDTETETETDTSTETDTETDTQTEVETTEITVTQTTETTTMSATATQTTAPTPDTGDSAGSALATSSFLGVVLALLL